MSTTHLFTGLQPFWNYDSFTVKAKGFGSGIGRINVAGGKLVDAGSGENPYSLPTDFNFSFQSFELALKFHNNPPMLTRFWNSTENDQTVSVNDHFGLFGKWWTSNYEQCLVENTGDNIVTEIGPSGERNVYTESGGTYTSPAGVLKDLSKTSSEFDLMTRGYYTCHFKHLSIDEENLYRLEYIKDKNNVRVYVVWESVASKYRIKNIAVSTDSGTTKTNVLSFKYVTLEISSTTYHFISEITDNANRVWSYTYDTDNKGLLVRAHYPSGIDVEYVYNTSGGSPTYNLEQIIDPRKHAWIVDYTNKLWKIQVGGEWHYTYYDWSIDTATGVVTSTRRDPRSSSSSDDNYRTVYTSNTTGNITGNVVSRKITDTSSSTWIEWRFEWADNLMTKVTEPNAVDSGERNYTTYSYNSDGLLEYTKNYKMDVEQTRLRQKNSYNTGGDKYELASLEKDFSGGTYYCSKTEYTHDTQHRVIKTVSGINPDPNAQCDPENCSLYITVSYEYDSYGNVTRAIDPQGNYSSYQYNAVGAVLLATDTCGATTRFTYDSLSLNVISQTNALGTVFTFLYDGALVRIGSIDPLGNRFSQTYDASGNILSYSGPSGTARMRYDEKNRLIEETQPNGLVTYFSFYKNGIMSSKRYYLAESDSSTATEYEQSYLCHNSGRVYRYTDAEGQYIEFTFDKTGNMLTLVDRNSVTSWMKTYDFANRLTKVTFPRVNGYEGSVTYEYDGHFGNTSKETKTSNYLDVDTNQETTLAYDRAGRLYKTTFPQYSYRGITYTCTVFNYYNQAGQIVKVVRRKNDGQTNSDNYVIYEYDKVGRINIVRKQAQTDSQGEVNNEIVTCYGYDAVGNRTNVSVNGIMTATTSYDALGRPLVTTQASGQKVVKVYSGSCGSGKVQAVNDSQTASSVLANQMMTVGVSSIEPSKTSTAVYDSNGRIAATVGASGLAITREYMANGWIKRTTWSNGDSTSYCYNMIGDVTRVEEVAPGYDGQSYDVRSTLEVRYGWGTYTPTAGTGFTNESDYNRWEEYVTKKSDTPHYYGTVYFYDENNRLAEVRFLDADDSTERKIKYLYDGFGNLIKETKADSNILEYTYDNRNRMTRIKYDANNYNDYEYSCCGMLERHQHTVDGSQLDPFELTYDKGKRVTKEQYPDSGSPKTQYFTYSYDNANRRTKLTDPTYGPGNGQASDKPMRYKYDPNGRMTVIGREEDNAYHQSTGEDYSIVYDDQGRISKLVYPGENNIPVMEVEYRYTSGGWIDKIIARNIKSTPSIDIYCIEYSYDSRGRISGEIVKDKENDPYTSAYHVISYRYDTRDMLVEEKYQRWNVGDSCWDVVYDAEYKYDTACNTVYRRVSQLVSGTTKVYEDASFVYSRGYHLRQFTRTAILIGGNESHNVVFTYDANGNCTHILQSGSFTDNDFYGIPEMEFQYDASNRLKTFRYGGTGNWNEIKYDSIGRIRERINTSSVVSRFYYDHEQLVQQVDSSNEVDFDYFPSPLGLMRQIDETGAGDDKSFYILDGHRTVRALVDPSDFSVERYNYNSWGEHIDNGSSYPSTTNSIRYIGSRLEGMANANDGKGALYHFGVRHYLAYLGIFLQMDPLKTVRSPKPYYSKDAHSYIYADNNPVMLLDRTGLYTPCSQITGQMVTGCTEAGIGAVWSPQNYQSDLWCECDKYTYVDPITALNWGFIYYPSAGNPDASWTFMKLFNLYPWLPPYLCGYTSGAAPDIEAAPKVCCEILRQCKICTDQRILDELNQIRTALPSDIINAYSSVNSCMCQYGPWENADPVWAQQAEDFCKWFWWMWPGPAQTCDCQWWQSWAYTYMGNLTGKAGGTKCWGYCYANWGVPGNPIGHFWVTIWPDKYLRSEPVREFDVWGFGQTLLSRKEHEQYFSKTYKSFLGCYNGYGWPVYLGFNPGY